MNCGNNREEAKIKHDIQSNKIPKTKRANEPLVLMRMEQVKILKLRKKKRAKRMP